MSLASRILVVLLVVFLGFTGVDFLIQRRVVYHSFLDLELHEARQHLQRCVEALDREVHHLQLHCNDWAAWDATYDFVVTGAPEYIQSNLVDATFLDSQINLLYVCDREGRVVWGVVMSLPDGAPLSLSEFPPDRLPAGHPLLKGAERPDGLAGFLHTAAGPMLVAAQPILTSGNQGPSRGVFIMGRLLDRAFLEEFTRHLRVDVHVWSVAADDLPEEARGPLERLTATPGPGTYPLRDNELVRVHTLVPDVQGGPGLLMRVDIPRSISQRGRTALNYATASVLQVGLLILAVALVLLRRMVIAPVTELTERITAFGAGREQARETATDARRDELGTLAREFGLMTRQVADARQTLVQQARELEATNERLQHDIERRRKVEAELRARERQLRSLASELALTEQRERRQIAELLHDHASQTLAMAKLRLQSLQQEAGTPERDETLGAVVEMLNEVLGQCRTLTFELSPPILHELGLEAALEWLAETMDRRGLHCDFHDDGEPKPLPEDARIILFSAVRELLANVVKHAEATTARVNLARDGNLVVATVADDGVGMDRARMGAGPEGSPGFGLRNLRERMGYLGGEITIQGGADGGTVVTLSLPLQTDNGKGVGNHAHEDHPC